MKAKLLLFSIVLIFAGADAFAQCKGNCRNGKGVYTFKDGEVYNGTFKDGQFDGKGTYTYKSGAKYVGEFVAGKRHGQGTYTYPTGDIYTGDFVNGVPEGKGVYTFATGDRYEGEFKNGERNGQGVYIFASGTRQTGIFEDNELIEEISIERKKTDEEWKDNVEDIYAYPEAFIVFSADNDSFTGGEVKKAKLLSAKSVLARDRCETRERKTGRAIQIGYDNARYTTLSFDLFYFDPQTGSAITLHSDSEKITEEMKWQIKQMNTNDIFRIIRIFVWGVDGFKRQLPDIEVVVK
jgi:hypothetical protein